MNIRTLLQGMVCALLLVSLFAAHQPVHAQEVSFVEIPLEALHDETPIQLEGLISTQSVGISVPQSWVVGNDNWMDLRLRVSPLLDAARSSITITLNDHKIASYNLTNNPGTEQRLLLPADRFTQGSNTLTFTGSLYLPDDSETNCKNWNDPARWLAVEPGSLLHLSFSRHDSEVNLSHFPQALIDPLEKYTPHPTRRPPLIVLPEDSTQDDLTSLSTLSYVMGNDASSGYDWHPEIVRASQWEQRLAANRNVIFIGNPPAELQTETSPEKNYVGLFRSPWGEGNAVLVIGDQNRQDGFTPAAVFGDRTRSMLLQGNLAYIDKIPPAVPQPFPNRVTFEEMGYLDRTIRGTGRQNLIYSLYVPYHVEPMLVKLHLGLIHSPDIDMRTSTFTVFLNGYSIAGIRPNDRSSAGELLTIDLPAKKFRRGINFIRVQFDMHAPESSCERGLESIWATILNNSTLETTFREHTPIPSLKHFPLPFSDTPGVAFVIPDRYSQQDLEHISQLSFLLGSSAYRPQHPPQLMTASDFERLKTKPLNVILVGLPSENKVTRSANDLLPQPFQPDGNALQEGYGVYLPTSQNDVSLGLMEIIPSPWTRGGTILVLTGNDRQGLDWTWDVILNPTLQEKFSGNLMVVGSEHRSQSAGQAPAEESPQALFQQIADASNIPIIGPLLQRSGKEFLLPGLVAIGSALFLVIGILWVMDAAKRRVTSDAFVKAEEEHTDEQ